MRVNIRALIIRGDKIVLCKNIKGGFYFLPGGGLEEGETINQCIIRELKEETNIKENEVLINKSIETIEHIFEDKGIVYHEINLIKNVYVTTDVIESREDHLEFEEVKVNVLHTYKLLPEKIKSHILTQLEL
ncbi:MAG: NUDIX domain-containing protein [Alphaproteobacteria bacterium]|nr:NUDIX domain-containing protein [Alphaproteobacteria bacterium]NCB50059.1 NUDIX domain-containing protein [Alphaproteobacteria bacterium]